MRPWPLAVLLVLLAVQPASAEVVVGTGVVFRPSEAYVDISFSSAQTFQRAPVIDSDSVTFDLVELEFEKRPAQVPRATVSITTWNPTAGFAGEVALAFTATAQAGDTVWFNITGLHGSRQYELERSGAPARTLDTDTRGRLSFTGTQWSTETYRVVMGRAVGGPTGGGPRGDDWLLVAVVVLVALMAALFGALAWKLYRRPMSWPPFRRDYAEAALYQEHLGSGATIYWLRDRRTFVKLITRHYGENISQIVGVTRGGRVLNAGVKVTGPRTVVSVEPPEPPRGMKWPGKNS